MERILRQKLPGGQFQNVSPTRAKIMAAVCSKGNKTTERKLRMALVRANLTGWTLHPKDIFGHPDFFFPQNQLAIFVDGCFWHGCPKCGHLPKSNIDFWKAKIERNHERDAKISEKLRECKIQVIRIWEHELAEAMPDCIARIKATLRRE